VTKDKFFGPFHFAEITVTGAIRLDLLDVRSVMMGTEMFSETSISFFGLVGWWTGRILLSSVAVKTSKRTFPCSSIGYELYL